MKILVLGATGTVGSQVTRELLARKQKVRVLTRDPKKAKALGDVEAFKGDVLEPASVRGMYRGIEGVFILNPVSQTEASEGLMAVTGAMEAGVKRIVYMSVQHAERAPHLPHFGAKVGVEAGVKASGTEWTILRPSNFYQNDHWFKEGLLKYGVYGQPLGDVGVSRVDVRDIAEMAAIALTEKGHAGKTYELVGPRPITGEETAGIWSKALGRTISYAGNDLDAWEKQWVEYVPAYVAYDFRHMFDHFQKKGLAATTEEVEALAKALGHAPRSFEAFAEETAKLWSKEQSGSPA